MKLWEKGFSTDKLIENFTIGKDRELDILLAESDVIGSIAHIKMLQSINLLSKKELDALTKELINIYFNIKKDKFVIHEGIEDVHSQVEFLLTQKLGDTGKKIHSGRSRNDQVLLDIKLFIRTEIQDITSGLVSLFNQFISLSEKHKSVLMPGYTHLQIAMPSSFGLWFGAYAESLIDDLVLLQAAYKITNQNPLGSGAGYGSSFPLNRQMTTDLLGFENMNYNVVYAQMGRGKVEKTVAFAMSSISATMAKFSMDTCLFVNQNFGFISFPNNLTTGSSIMPHKKNPDVFELIRAKCNKIQALPNEIVLITSNLPSGYQRDLQLIKEVLFPAFDELKTCLGVLEYMLQHVIVNKRILNDEKYNYLFSVEEVNKEVVKGIPFREAYKKIGLLIEKGQFEPEKSVKHTHEGSIGNLCNNKIKDRMNTVLNDFNFDKANSSIQQLLNK